ncbi:unnamed protein product [Linum tenue]|uniref:Cytidyltransferase-like domain-containing protein n=1 Tax=Linum tenue TaxID=586396 RepID=A0AAV0H1H6_9ROSI|nr:unnamed protein product [Linum tenue]
MEFPLPMDKVSVPTEDDGKVSVVLVATGSFNPPTFMHLRMFELARDALQSEGYRVIAGYMSPVTDVYKKPGLIPAEHRLRMCNLACESSDFIMVDPWEVRTICRDHGIACIRREELDVDRIIAADEILNQNKDNIKPVTEPVPNMISSTRLRDCISRGLSIKYLTADSVISYIREHQLYLGNR